MGERRCVLPIGYMHHVDRDGHDAGKARDAFLKALDLGADPTLDGRSSDTPVGLKVRRMNLCCDVDRELMFRMLLRT